MLSAHKQQDCPRRAGAEHKTGSTTASRPGRKRAHRGIELDMPRVLSAGTFALAVASAAVLMLAGCATPGHQAPPAVQRSAETLGLAADRATTAVDAQWWRQFGDAQLDALVDKALAGAPSIAAAQARLVKAQSVIDATRGTDGPQVGLDVSANRQRLSENGLYPPPYAGSVFNTGDAHLGFSWAPDFFGRHRADLEAALGGARAAQADAAVAAQQIATQVVRTYFSLARLESQRLVATATLAQREEMLRLIRQRVGAGLDTVVELRQGEGALPDTRAQIEQLDEQITLARHLLAAIAAQPVQSLDGLAPTLAQLHAAPQPAVLGADLLARRPEIAAALARVEAATHQVESQRTRFYPDINFTAMAGLNAIGFDNFAEWGSRNWGFGPALHLPIFEGGALRAELKGKGADRDAAIQSYNQAVIDAVREAADAASSAASIGRQQAQQQQALASAESSYAFAQQRYAQGLGNQLIVLNAETQTLAQRRLDVDLKYRALDVQAQLMKALGGGWSAPQGFSAIPAAAASAPAATAKNDTLSPA
jgi:NodT family efflux transporter outer membrane factor (OMF) lipoprotein